MNESFPPQAQAIMDERFHRDTLIALATTAVSYTHLDVYKRQIIQSSCGHMGLHPAAQAAGRDRGGHHRIYILGGGF